MATNPVLNIGNKVRSFASNRRSFTVGKIIFNKKEVPSVPGLSPAVLKVPKEPVGPGAAKNTDYKNPEYFCYDQMSYFEAELEMLKYRGPQPSNKIKYEQPKA